MKQIASTLFAKALDEELGRGCAESITAFMQLNAAQLRRAQVESLSERLKACGPSCDRCVALRCAAARLLAESGQPTLDSVTDDYRVMKRLIANQRRLLDKSQTENNKLEQELATSLLRYQSQQEQLNSLAHEQAASLRLSRSTVEQSSQIQQTADGSVMTEWNDALLRRCALQFAEQIVGIRRQLASITEALSRRVEVDLCAGKTGIAVYYLLLLAKYQPQRDASAYTDYEVREGCAQTDGVCPVLEKLYRAEATGLRLKSAVSELKAGFAALMKTQFLNFYRTTVQPMHQEIFAAVEKLCRRQDANYGLVEQFQAVRYLYQTIDARRAAAPRLQLELPSNEATFSEIQRYLDELLHQR